VKNLLSVTAGIILALYTFARSIVIRVTKGIRHSESGSASNVLNMAVGSTNKEESRPPLRAPGFTTTNLSSCTLKRLGELEEKVDMLQSKPNVMPYEKEELLNAAVYRVDALEAELIATKKGLYPFLNHFLNFWCMCVASCSTILCISITGVFNFVNMLYTRL